MHIVLAGLYSTILWLSLLAYLLILGSPVWSVLLLGPVIISGLIAVLIGLDLLVSVLVAWFMPYLLRWRALASGALRRTGRGS